MRQVCATKPKVWKCVLSLGASHCELCYRCDNCINSSRKKRHPLNNSKSPDLSWKRVKKTPFIRLTNLHPPAKYDLSFYPTSDVGYDKPLKLIHSFGPGKAGTFTTTLILSSPHRLPLDSSSGHKVAPAFHFFR